MVEKKAYGLGSIDLERIAQDIKAGAGDAEVGQKNSVSSRLVQVVRIDILGIRRKASFQNPFEEYRRMNSVGLVLPFNSITVEKLGLDEDKDYEWTITKHNGRTFTVKVREKE